MMRTSLSINKEGNPIQKLVGLRFEFSRSSVEGTNNISEGKQTEKYENRKVGGLRGGC